MRRMSTTRRLRGPRVRPRIDRERLVEDMAAKGWLQRDLAAKAGLHVMTVSRLMRGHLASVKVLTKAAKALGHPVRRYIAGAIVPPPPDSESERSAA